MTPKYESYGNLDREHYCYTLTAEGSRLWGAYLAPGTDSPDAARFRSMLRTELSAVATELDGVIEIFASGRPIDAQDWMVGRAEPA